jgi:hypothetical protein
LASRQAGILSRTPPDPTKPGSTAFQQAEAKRKKPALASSQRRAVDWEPLLPKHGSSSLSFCNRKSIYCTGNRFTGAADQLEFVLWLQSGAGFV